MKLSYAWMKCLLVAVLVLGILTVGVEGASAQTLRPGGIMLTVGNDEMLVGSKRVDLDNVVPVVNNGRVFVPLRAVAEGFGAEVSYDKATGDVTITSKDDKIVMNTRASVYLMNGELRWMDIAPFINAQNRTMVPVRFISDALGYEISTGSNSRGAVSTIYINQAMA